MWLLFRPFAALRYVPVDVFVDHFDRARLAMNAVRRVYLQPSFPSGLVLDELVDFCGAETLLHACEFFEALQWHRSLVFPGLDTAHLIRRCDGWSASWLVPLLLRLSKMSKVRMPSFFSYSMGCVTGWYGALFGRQCFSSISRVVSDVPELLAFEQHRRQKPVSEAWEDP